MHRAAAPVTATLATGDIATVDDEGYFYIVDRKKDMILVSGFNVFPNEIEEVAAMHENIVEAAAVGVPHEVSGEVVKLFVVRNSDSLTEKDVIAHCRNHLTGYKVPKQVHPHQQGAAMLPVGPRRCHLCVPHLPREPRPAHGPAPPSRLHDPQRRRPRALHP